ncbi:MAG: hypothetical protein ACI8VT_001575 [Saprospiraceae bacterium]|jgi:hypothetical protein
MNNLIVPFFCFFLVSSLSAQISLDNASFEGEAEDATLPSGWLQCKQGTTPDILPGAWGVYNEPSDGETYMGLITRSDKTWESVGQRLSQPIKAGQCYSLNVDLAHSNTYTGYNKSVKLRVWAGKTRCSRGQLLWESKVIDHSYWETYEFFFEPKATFNYIIIEAYFPDDNPIPYKGNILIDNISDIEICERA